MTFIYASHLARVSSAVTFNTMGSVVFLDSKVIPIRQHGQVAEICKTRVQMNGSVKTKMM